MNYDNNDEFTAKQENNILSVVHSDLDAYYITPLKTKVIMLVHNTLDTTPVVKGINIVDLDMYIKRCIARLDTLESDLAMQRTHLTTLQNQLMELQNESNGTVLGKLVVIKDEE